ncbi:YbhB/YbcL family Raf kinase inhibitor-like protein [Brenneria tiliae]|uniref:YbhB/YbcL family Raf kinase inhibitor-like protein n=1 Tax=Brenneria tiliae TaxID=2914984 RepID=A0ABT0N109_9GAMM|nr:YbhB/YbcL family Raf kinase inhibitor-like protein [Brenneria tiliae]MCL2895794.1 YbhB/YbcL family Raf kinase inhibitor-like protein [Brenneria tiliae]MCL2900294.1 YbhB/YbcL family Raf kinase inhibitor-like protein [Brenneria tiliae]MCL2904219.1 YbhB/YbcL family Raf kinase inhibitor-like protein [Brenneria tiliae]
MKLTSQSFEQGAPIPGEFAFAVQDAENHLALSSNKNPHLSWSEVPAATRSLVLLCVDPHAPSTLDNVNQEGKEVAASVPRVNFFHWVLVDIPAQVREIAAGSHSDGITPRGKAPLSAEAGIRHGINDYTAWFKDDEQMSGDYYGYDGPCPPWNDTLAHDYTFTLYALDIPSLELQGKFDGPTVLSAIAGHILAEASLTGTYSLNPDVR